MGTEEQRRDRRTLFACRIKISHPQLGERIVSTRDISDGGVFILLDKNEVPPIGSIVQGQVQGLTDDAPILDMEVVRIEDEGIGLRFLLNT